MISGSIYFVYVIVHCDVLIIVRLLVSIIGKLCSRLIRVESNKLKLIPNQDLFHARSIIRDGLSN